MTGWPFKNMAAWKEPVIWVCGGVVVFALWLGLTFPYEALHTRVIGELQRRTGIEVHAAYWTVGFPLALEWRHVTVSKAGWAPVELGAMRARLGVLQALTGGVALDLTAQLDAQSPAKGTVSSTVTAPSWSLTGPLTVTGNIKQIDLSKLVGQYVSRGTLTGEFTQRLDTLPAASPASFGEGTWRMDVKDLSLDEVPVGNGRTLSLAVNTLSVGLSCREQICTVTELKGDGIDGSLSGEGTIAVQLPVQQSQLALSLTVIPGAGFAAKAGSLGIPPLPPGTPFTFKVQGTLARARLAL
ncbi:type II secretion system protein GspN [Nitrospira sp. NS4]|uniref:type II secretion system protein GspN n=1 Tax=Nitrospira sp. NS4 TaxID=3414498 RepID=UPI003C2B1BD5